VYIVKELSVRYRRRQLPGRPQFVGRLTTPSQAAALCADLLKHEVVEVCGVLCLSTKNEVLAYHEMSRGTLDAALVHPRDVFRTALLANAASVLVAHNHPSDDVTPSPEDVALTHRLVSAGDVVGIPLADHIIVGLTAGYFSFRETARL
jgi:DNA repair protein RadC